MADLFITQKKARLGTLNDKSSTITSGGAAQTLMAANPFRAGYWIQNLSTGDLYINDVGTATTSGSSLRIPAGSLYECPVGAVPTSAISIIGATTGQAFSSREW